MIIASLALGLESFKSCHSLKEVTTDIPSLLNLKSVFNTLKRF